MLVDSPMRSSSAGKSTLGEVHLELEKSAFPQCLLLARNTATPFHKVKTSLGVLCWLRVESKRMVLSPLLTVKWNLSAPKIAG